MTRERLVVQRPGIPVALPCAAWRTTLRCLFSSAAGRRGVFRHVWRPCGSGEMSRGRHFFVPARSGPHERFGIEKGKMRGGTAQSGPKRAENRAFFAQRQAVWFEMCFKLKRLMPADISDGRPPAEPPAARGWPGITIVPIRGRGVLRLLPSDGRRRPLFESVLPLKKVNARRRYGADSVRTVRKNNAFP